ncbi:MAG: hypothetical protein ABL932_25850 [Terricaulis sp.]
MRRVRVIIIHEPEQQGFGAGSPDLLAPEFFLIGSSIAVIEAALSAALEAHCGERVAFEIISRPT